MRKKYFFKIFQPIQSTKASAKSVPLPRLTLGEGLFPAITLTISIDMENKLDFLRSYTVEEFKQMQGVEEIQILRNETTGKCFFSYAGKSGAVTTRYPEEPLRSPLISEVVSTETGETFFLLHSERNKATKLATL